MEQQKARAAFSFSYRIKKTLHDGSQQIDELWTEKENDLTALY